jgi:excisionase family DNA binding protein
MTTKLTDYLLTAEAAEAIGVSQNTLRAWAKAGKIPVHRNPANGYRLFKRNDLAAFLSQAAVPVDAKARHGHGCRVRIKGLANG